MVCPLEAKKSRNCCLISLDVMIQMNIAHKITVFSYLCKMPKYVFDPITLQYQVREGPRWHRPARIAIAVVSAIGLCYLYFWIFTSVLGLDLPKTARLKREAAAWEARMALVDRRLDLFETTLEGVEDRDDHVYRSIYGLGTIPIEAKNSGLGSASRYDYLDEMGAASSLKTTLLRMDNLTKRVYIQSIALDEVRAISLTAGDMLAHIPSVPPILPDRRQFRLASAFGYRVDPVYGGVRFHEGQDFAAHVGYPVYATGDGVVIKTEFKFSGYGNEVMIDHGFGYKTRYAHLSRIDVAEGIKVSRGDLIGAIGNTGKSTGPHLHYEVIYMGRPVNPWRYMNLDMSVEEYLAMVKNRREEASPKQKSSLQLLDSRKR